MIDFDLLKDEGLIIKRITYEDLDEALSAYKAIYEGLSATSEVYLSDEGNSFAFSLHITPTSPYTITTQIDLV